MRETEIHRELCKNFPPPLAAITRFENVVRTGVFDANISHVGRDHWIEYKVQEGNQIKVSGTQYIWANERIASLATNLWFIVMRTRELPPVMYSAYNVLSACNPNHNDGKRHMLVDVRSILTKDEGWAAIRKTLFGY